MAEWNGRTEKSSKSVAGHSVLRRDLYEKVTGAAQYAVDVNYSGQLHAKVVRSIRAHATIVSIDKTAALASPGVVGVVTGADLHGIFPRFGHIITDHNILAIDKVRYYGEPVALVLAETPHEAADGADLVDIEYDDLEAVLDLKAALAQGAPLVHEHGYNGTEDDSFKELTAAGESDPVDAQRTNIAHEVTIGWGDVDAAFAAAHLVVENTTHYPMLYAYAMEPYNAVAEFTDHGLDVTSTAQHPFMVRDDLVRIFSLPLSRVRVRVPYIGGGYGSKSYTKVEPLAAVGAWYSRRPVKLVLDVEESIYTTRVDPAVTTMRTAFAADGTILARDFDMTMDSGAYADNSPLVLAKAVNRAFGPYRVPNLRARGRSVYTNTSPASSYRGFGAPQGNLAGETNLDQAADRLGISSADIRRKNLVDHDEEILPGHRGLDADIKADLEMVVESLERDRKDVPFYGIGFSCSASDAGAYPVSTAQVRIQTDGSVILASGSTEMGQGSRSVLAQIAAEELGVELQQVMVVQSDSSGSAYERTTGASRTTTLVGLAIQRACADARHKIREMAAESRKVEPDEVEDVPGGVIVGGEKVGFGGVIVEWFGAAAGEVTGIGLVRRDGVTQKMPPFWELGMVGVAVEIDPDTGGVHVDQLVTVADVGFAINPAAVEAQDLGAATQGLGAALHEELVYDGAQLVNANVVDYRIPRAKDLPRKLDLMIAERGDGVGPYGAKGAGEGTLNPIGGAVAAAVARATGKWPNRLPLTPERTWRLLNDLPESDD